MNKNTELLQKIYELEELLDHWKKDLDSGVKSLVTVKIEYFIKLLKHVHTRDDIDGA
jgi:hypothetical protein